MIALIIFLGFTGFCIYAFYADRKDTRKDEADTKENHRIWLEEENKKPFLFVQVLTKTGKIYQTTTFAPICEVESWLNGFWLNKSDSLSRAKSFVESQIRHGRFYHESENLYIPLCEIESMKVISES